MRGLRRHLSYANVVASVALFFVLGGGAYAAVQFPKNSIDSKQIRVGAIGPSELRAGAVRSTAIAKRSILTEDLATKRGGPLPLPSVCPPGQLAIPKVQGTLQGKIVWRCIDPNPLDDFPPGMAPCPEGTFDPTTQNIFGQHCLPIPGLPADGAENPPDGLPTCPPNAVPGTLCTDPSEELTQGTIIRGVIGEIGPLAAGKSYLAYASLPFQATEGLSNIDILVSEFDDPDDECTGTFSDPTAPEGKVCVYLIETPGVTTVTGRAIAGLGSRFGFSIRFETVAAGIPDPAGAEGSWAYTAPEPPTPNP